MAADSAQLDAIKLVGDWCKWYSAIATGAITAIAALIVKDCGLASIFIRVFLGIAVGSFLLSVILAGFVLSSLPEAVQNIMPGNLVWDRKADLLGRRNIRFGVLISYIMWSFFAGIGTFTMGIVGILIVR